MSYYPERQISRVIHLLTEGSPAEQKDALDAYFLPDASFIHPLCRVPSFSHLNLPFIGDVNSRWAIWMIYRWYKILSPRIVLNVECDGRCSFSVSPLIETDTRSRRVQPRVVHPFRRRPPDLLSVLRSLLQIRRPSHCQTKARAFRVRRQVLYQVSGGSVSDQ